MSSPQHEQSPSKTATLGQRVLSATMAIAVAHFIAKGLGLVQARVIGHYYGFGMGNDAFVFAYEGILFSLFLIGEESLGPAVLPVFMSAKNSDSERRAWDFLSTLWNLQVMILLAAVVLLMIFPTQAIALLSRFDNAGSKNLEHAARAHLAARFLTGMAPALVGLSLGSLTYMILNGYKSFFWPAFADAILKAALVIGFLAGHSAGLGDDALIAGVLAAGFAKLSVHLLALRKKLPLYRPLISLSDPHFKKFLILVAPLIAGILFAKFRDYFNYYYIISSLEEGMLSVNSYGRKIYNAVGWLVPYPLSIAMFPFFCELVARDDQKSLGDFLTRSTRMLLLVFVPLTAMIIVLSVPLAQALFQTGKVTAADAALAGRVNACYSAVLPFYALEFIFMQAYFSTHRTVSVTIIGIIFSTLSMVISYLGVVVWGLTGPDAVVLVALGYSGSRALKTVALAAVLKAHGLPLLPLGKTIPFIARVCVVAAACTAVCFFALKGVEHFQAPPDLVPAPKSGSVSGLKALLKAAPQLALPGLAGAIVFFIACKLLMLNELDEMIGFAREKLSRRSAKKSTQLSADDGNGSGSAS